MQPLAVIGWDKYVDNNNLKTKKSYINADNVKRQKIRWTIVLILLSFIFQYLYIFHSHKMKNTVGILIFLCVILPTIIPLIWFKFINVTPWQKIKTWLSSILIAFPFLFATTYGQEKFCEYQLQSYKTLTTGVVTKTYDIYNSRGATTSYWADVSYQFDNQTKLRPFCMNQKDEYKTGDSIIVIYSSNEPEIYALGGRK